MNDGNMKQFSSRLTAALGVSLGALALTGAPAWAQVQKPNIILIVSDDFGYGDRGVYGGGENRGQPTPSLDRIANEGMQFWSFYGQPSCTPGRAAMMTGRIPNRSGMTTVSFQGQGGGLPAAEWTLGSVLKTDRRLRHLLHRQMAPRRGRLCAPQRAGLRCHEILRALSSQRLHLRGSDMVPGHVGRASRHVQQGHQGRDVGQRGRNRARGVQDQRPICRHAG
jgi:hypothetical protein